MGGTLDGLSYGQMQERCRLAGLPARGSAHELRERLAQLELVRRDSQELRTKLQAQQQQRFESAAQRIEEELEQQHNREQRRRQRDSAAAASAATQQTGAPVEEKGLGQRREARQPYLSAQSGPVPLTCEVITPDGTISATDELPAWVRDLSAGSFATTVRQYESVWAAQAANTAAALSPRMLNRRIASAPSVCEVLRLHQTHGADYNEVHLSTTWSRLGRVATAPERRRMLRDPSMLGPLRQQTAGSLLLLRPRWGARAVASTAYSVSKLGLHGSLWSQLWQGLGVASLPLMRDFTAQALANTAWAFARSRGSTQEMFDAIAAEALPRLDEFKPQELASLAWAFATIRAARRGSASRLGSAAAVELELLDAIALRAAARRAEFMAQGLANIAWAFAAAGHPSVDLFHAIAAEAEPRLGEFKPQELANIAWAFTKAGVQSPEFFSSLAERATARLSDFTPKSLESSAWLKGRVYANRLGEFAPQGLANTAWAFAAAGHAAPALFDALANEATPRLAEFKSQELCNLAWAFATADHPSPTLFDAMASRATVLMGELFTAQGLANTAWAFAAVGRPAPVLFDRIAAEAVPRLREFKPQELANLVWAFATAGVSAPDLFEAAAAQSACQLNSFKPQELANVAWAFTAANHTPVAASLFDAAFGRRCDQFIDSFDDGSLFQLHQWVLWQERELGRSDGLPCAALRSRCRTIFAARASRQTRLHRQVRAALHSLGLRPREGVRLAEGYRLELVIQWRGADVVVQVDGPWRFAGRRPTGMTMLRRRQLGHLGWRLLPLPHWEWSSLRPERDGMKKMQTYLLYALEHRVI